MNFDSILTSKLKPRMFFLIGIILLGTVLEIAGISLIIPVIISIIDPAFTTKYSQVEQFISYFIEPTHANVIFFGISFLILFYVFKTIYLVFMVIMQGRFVYKVKEDIGNRLFCGYLFKPYDFFLNQNSAQLIRNLTTEVANLGVVLRAGMLLFTDGIILISVTCLLFIVEPFGTFIIFSVLSLSAIIFQFFTKAKLVKFGHLRQFHEGKRIQNIQQGLSSIKNVKILSREKIFLKWFSQHNSAGVQAERFQFIIAAMPRYFLEFVVVIGLAGLVSAQFISGKSVESITLILGVYAIAIFRLLPSFNRMIAASQQIRFCWPAYQIIGDELRRVEERERDQISYDKQLNSMDVPTLSDKIKLHNLFFKHAGVEEYVIKNINIEIPKGSFIGIIGGSGAGKSTLVDLILGLLTPTKGYVEIDKMNIQNSIKSWQSQLGYVPQNIDLVDDTIRNNIAFGVLHKEINEAFVERAVKSSHLDLFVSQLPDGLDTIIGEQGVRLSGGQRQRIGVARALYHDPKILILDEATSSLDMDTEAEIMNTINALHGKKTIILISHRPQTLRNCDMIYHIEAGSIIRSGSYAELIKT